MNGPRPIQLGLLAIALLIVACTVDLPANRRPIVGSGDVALTTRSLPPVNEIELAGPGTLTVRQGPTETLTIEAEDNILPLLKADVVGTRLIVRQADGSGLLQPTRPITLHLMVRSLRGLDVTGAGSAVATGIATDQLAVQVSGSGTLRLNDLKADLFSAMLNGSGSLIGSGMVRQEKIVVRGSGPFVGDALQAAEASVSVSGTGNASVWASERLNLQIAGPGDVTYRGTPTVTRHLASRGGRPRIE